jgi:two-component system CheB/CheR fusion protein
MAGGKQRVLLVEDDSDACEAMAAVLELWEVEVDSTADGAQALALARVNQYRAVLVDLSIPPPGAYSVARELKARAQPTTLIAVTGRSDAATAAMALEAGFDHFVTKPVNLESLAQLLFQR